LDYFRAQSIYLSWASSYTANDGQGKIEHSTTWKTAELHSEREGQSSNKIEDVIQYIVDHLFFLTILPNQPFFFECAYDSNMKVHIGLIGTLFLRFVLLI
jgi:hypothetical protein